VNATYDSKKLGSVCPGIQETLVTATRSLHWKALDLINLDY